MTTRTGYVTLVLVYGPLGTPVLHSEGKVYALNTIRWPTVDLPHSESPHGGVEWRYGKDYTYSVEGYIEGTEKLTIGTVTTLYVTRLKRLP